MSDGISDANREMEEARSNEDYRKTLARHLLGEADRTQLDAAAAQSDNVKWRARQLKITPTAIVDAELKGLVDEDRNRRRVAWAKLIASTFDLWPPGYGDKSYGEMLGRISPFKNSFFMLYSQGSGFSNAPPGFSKLLEAVAKEHGYEAARGRSRRVRLGEHLVVIPRSVLIGMAKAAVIQVSADRRTAEEAARDEADFKKTKSARRLRG